MEDEVIRQGKVWRSGDRFREVVLERLTMLGLDLLLGDSWQSWFICCLAIEEVYMDRKKNVSVGIFSSTHFCVFGWKNSNGTIWCSSSRSLHTVLTHDERSKSTIASPPIQHPHSAFEVTVFKGDFEALIECCNSLVYKVLYNWFTIE